MKLGVVGSRTITGYDVVRSAINSSPWYNKRMDRTIATMGEPRVTIVSGGADGVDSSAEKFASKNNLDLEVKEPDYTDWGGEHPATRRNTKIVEESDAIVAVWDGCSNGTRDSIDKSLDRGVPIYVEVVEP